MHVFSRFSFRGMRLTPNVGFKGLANATQRDLHPVDDDWNVRRNI
jgi:hypothetical protein